MDIINLQNLNLYYNYDSRFKTIAVCLYFYFPIEEKYIPETLMLAQMLQKTSKRYPTEESFAYHLKSIYETGKRCTYGYGCSSAAADRGKSLCCSQRRPAVIIFCYAGLGLFVSAVEWNLESFVETGKE